MIFNALQGPHIKVFAGSIVHHCQTVEIYYGPYFLSHTVRMGQNLYVALSALCCVYSAAF